MQRITVNVEVRRCLSYVDVRRWIENYRSVKLGLDKQVARTADFAVRVFSVAIIATAPYSIAAWQPRFFDRDLRTLQEYNEKVEYIHLNPVRAGLVSRPEDWRWSSYNEYAGISAEEQKKRCGLIIDPVSIPSDPRARI